ncbi:MAG: putative Ig domain-containing protein [Verrucomicrobia bacterium]|nr:putative Ig domain-containing protein [Verrucomicrobiota bacterium]
MIDAITFVNMTSDISQGRFPDGASDLYFMTSPTPRGTNVIEANAPPVLAPIASTTVDEGTLLTFTASATDADPLDTLTFSLVPIAPDGAAIDPLTGVFTWTPTETQGGSSFLITVKVTDSGTRPLSDTKTFMVTVNKANSPPYFGGNPGPLVVGVLRTLTFANLAYDNDLPPDHLTFELLSAPSGVSLDPSTGVVTWTPTLAQAPSSNAIVVRVYDDGAPSLSATQTVTVLVTVANDPPQLTRPSDQTMDEMTPLVVNLTATDPDLPSQKLAYSLVSAPTGVALDGDTGVLNWTPTELQGPSTNVIMVAVSDNGTPSLSATQSFTVTVREINRLPVLEAVTNQTIGALTSLVITNLASDPDWPPNQLTFALLTGPTNATLDPSNGVFAWTPALAQSPSTNLIVISLTDDGVPPLSATQSFTLIVSVTNTAPVFVSNPGPMTIPELTTLVFTNLASDADAPANKLTFALLAAPDGVTLDANTGVITWTPTEAQGPSSNAIVLRVFDDGVPSLSATQTVTVFVTEVNVPPTLTVNPVYFVNEMQTFEVSLSAYDPDIPQETLTFGLVSGPDGMFLDPSGGWLLWTPTEAQGPSTNTVWVSIGDSGVPPITVTQSFLVVVLEINNPPVLDAIPDRVIHAGMTLSFTNHATDSDIPANLLTYTLGSAPLGASVDPASGVFTWTPSDPQAGSSYGVTVIVTDDGLPPMNDQKTFHITVEGRPSLQIAAADGAVTLTWSTIPRQTYRVEYADDLTTPLWKTLPGAGSLSSQTGADLSFTDTYGTTTQRFYRLVAY